MSNQHSKELVTVKLQRPLFGDSGDILVYPVDEELEKSGDISILEMSEETINKLFPEGINRVYYLCELNNTILEPVAPVEEDWWI